VKAHKYEIWKDNKSPVTRYVQVTREADSHGRVEITTIFRSEEKYSLPQVIENGMITYPRADRFHGMSEGYSYIAKNLKEFNAKQLGIILFAQGLHKRALVEASKVDLGTLSISALPKAEPLTGEIWRELKGTRMRYVQVVGDKIDGKVQIVTRYSTDVPGSRPQAVNYAKPTFALEGRFNGKAGGYEYVSKNLTELTATGLLSKRFVPAGQTLEGVLKAILPELAAGQVWHDTSLTNCFHLVKIVGLNDDQVEIATSYVSGDAADKVSTGKSEVVPVEAFALDMNRFVLVAA
jgi:hypothetical protein